MKKALKFVSVAVVSLLTVIIVTVSVLLWFVFTPERLTPIVSKQAGQFVTCKSEIGNVELTFFSTFPHFGLKINDLVLVNTMPGAPSDTLLNVAQVIAVIDASAWWKNEDVIIEEFHLKNVMVNAFTDSIGCSNFDILASSQTEAKKDTTAFSLQDLFHSAQLNKVTLSNVRLSYIDEQQKINVQVKNLQTELTAYLRNDHAKGTLAMTIPSLSVVHSGESYLQNASLKLNIPLNASLSAQSVTLEKAALILNGHQAVFDGTVTNNAAKGDINTNLSFSLDNWQIKEVLAMIPPQFSSMLKGVDADGIFTLTASLTGTYSKTQMPLINASLKLKNGTVKYDGLPLVLHDITGDVDLCTDLKTDSSSIIRIHAFNAKTPKSEVDIIGEVKNLLSDMQCDLKMGIKAYLPEWQPLIPKSIKMNMRGTANGSANAIFALSQVEKKEFSKMKIKGKLAFANLDVDYDTLNINLGRASVSFSVPNSSARANRENRFLQLALSCNNFNIRQGKSTTAGAQGANIQVTTSDLLKTNGLSTVHCDFVFDALNADMDGNFVSLVRPLGRFEASAYLNDKLAIPTLNCDLSMDSLFAVMDTISVYVKKPAIKANLQASSRNLKNPEVKLDYQSESLFARMGAQEVRTKAITASADLIHDKTQKNVLLQWVPQGFISLEDGWASLPDTHFDVRIPAIKFDFTPEKYTIKDSRILVANSDFQLLGELDNVASYLRGDSLLSGNFRFVSNETDITSLMDLTSGIGNKEEDEIATTDAADTASGPFMVPKGMNLTLETDIKKVFFKNDTAKNIRGKVLLNDGILILDNMNFTTSAAKMQLTAMYKTPRKNHLFIGLDYHMMDVEISELLAMIPDIDSIMPMLRSFGGKGEFHMAVQTYMDSLYNLKKSTLLGSASVTGQNLVLMDGETFGEIAKMLRFNKKTKNKVDSLAAEFTIFKEEIDVYPFLIVMDKYKAVVGGRHNLDMNFDYHISLIDSPLPVRLGVDVSGNLDKMKFRLAKCRYSRLYRPVSRRSVDTSQLELKKMIRDALVRKLKKEE